MKAISSDFCHAVYAVVNMQNKYSKTLYFLGPFICLIDQFSQKKKRKKGVRSGVFSNRTLICRADLLFTKSNWKKTHSKQIQIKISNVTSHNTLCRDILI